MPMNQYEPFRMPQVKKKNGITINRRSWHYWLVRKVRGWRGAPDALCPYMRWLLWGMIVAIICAGCGLILAAALVCAPIAWFTTLIDLPEETMSLVQFLALLGTILWGLATVAGVTVGAFELVKWGADKWDDRRDRLSYSRLNEPDEPEEREPSLLSMWWTVIHGKICPMLDFK